MPDFTGAYGKSGRPTTGAGKFTGSFGKSSKKTKKKGRYFDPEDRWRGGHKSGGKSLGGFVGNVVTDAAVAAYGAVPGLYQTGKAVAGDIASLPSSAGRVRQGQEKTASDIAPRTTKIAKAVAKSYADTYGPLVKGDWDTFADNLYKDAFFITLDAATLASLGVSGAAKLNIIPAKGGKIIELTTPSGKTVSKPLARGEMRAQLQSLAAKASNKERSVRGRVIRQQGNTAAKVESVRLGRQHANVAAKALPFERDLRRVRNNKERVALILREQFPDREALNGYMSHLREVRAVEGKGSPAAKTLAIIEKQGVQQAYNNPTPRMAKAAGSGRALSKDQAKLADIDPVAAEERRFRPSQFAGGGRYRPDPSAPIKVGSRVQLPDGRKGRVAHIYDDNTAAEVRLSKGGGRSVGAGLDQLVDLDAKAWVGGPSMDELKARGIDPGYYPHTSSQRSRSFSHAPQGGLGVPGKTGSMKQNQGRLLESGQMILDPGVLLESFGETAKFAHKQKVHQSLIDKFATEVDSLQQGWIFVREKKGDKVSPQDKARPDYEAWADEALDDKGEMGPSDDWFQGEKDPDMFTKNPSEAAIGPEGKHLAVPSSVARKLAGEFTRQSRLMYLINRYPMRIWRYLVLGTVPRYFVNNALGNTILLLFHSSRPADFKALVLAFREMVKPSDRKAFDKLVEAHAAGQLGTGFVATNFPRYKGSNKVSQTGLSIINAIPQADKRWERALRKEKLRVEFKRHPEFKEIGKRMGSENAYFENIKKYLDENPDSPHLAQVYDRVNDALGNYEGMSPFQRSAVRTLFPFWAWYRAIAGVAFKMAIEQPLKTTLIARLADIAVEENLSKMELEDAPSSTFGFLPSRQDPDGRWRGFNTPWAPHGTVGSLAEFFGALGVGEAGEAGKKMLGVNPLITEGLGRVTGKDLAGYSTENVPGIGTLEAVPMARLLSSLERDHGVDIPGFDPAPDGDTLNDRDLVDEFFRWLGIPYARVSPSAAKRVAER